ncbi:MAG: hypothetical protein EA372_02380 [Chromatiaceae bacterium]|nr:MAG: hypothetical protein EA372_02380 [Chromatiaceae bacterium]
MLPSGILALCVLHAPVDVVAQDALGVPQGIVQRAIETNPEVRASWHAFLAAEQDTRLARGGYRPTLDVTAGYGQEWRDGAGWPEGTRSEFSGMAADISMVQMLYDGFHTRSEVQRFDNAHLVRYFELLESVENTALAAVGAYQDVLRHRELVALAEKNLEQHRDIHAQIEESALAGIARRADLEQVSGRMSLAESNLMTDISNLHDVTARYLRIVGERPPEIMPELNLSEVRIPVDVREALHEAYESNPAFQASLRNIHATEASVETQRARYHPRLNLTARYGTQDYDDRGFGNTRNDGRIALEFHYNLYNGGRDQARLRRALEEVNQAKELRDKACVDIRQTVQIAFNDVQRLEEQLRVLNRHRVAADQVRLAYKDQFVIRERSLLDVLDSENEYFQASRAWANAHYDRRIAMARTLASMGQLLSAMSVVRDGLPTLFDLGAEPLVIDATTACPAEDVSDGLITTRHPR